MHLIIRIDGLMIVCFEIVLSQSHKNCRGWFDVVVVQQNVPSMRSSHDQRDAVGFQQIVSSHESRWQRSPQEPGPIIDDQKDRDDKKAIVRLPVHPPEHDMSVEQQSHVSYIPNASAMSLGSSLKSPVCDDNLSAPSTTLAFLSWLHGLFHLNDLNMHFGSLR